jgi:hypothetical protein
MQSVFSSTMNSGAAVGEMKSCDGWLTVGLGDIEETVETSRRTGAAQGLDADSPTSAQATAWTLTWLANLQMNATTPAPTSAPRQG